MFGKMFKRPQITDPSLQRLYAKEKAAEAARIRTNAHAVAVEKIKAMAKMDAQRAAMPTSTRVIKTASTIGAALGSRINKIDTAKFEAYVTGVSPEKKKK